MDDVASDIWQALPFFPFFFSAFSGPVATPPVAVFLKPAAMSSSSKGRVEHCRHVTRCR